MFIKCVSDTFSYTTSYGSLAYFVVEFLHPGHQRFYDCHQGSKAPPPIAASLSKMDATGSRGRRRHAPEVAGPFPMPIRGTSGDAQNGSGCPVGCGGIRPPQIGRPISRQLSSYCGKDI